MSQPLLLAVGPHGLTLTIPADVELLPLESPLEPGEALTPEQQREVVRAALARPGSTPLLKALAAQHRRAVIVVGGLAAPAPYEHVLPLVIQTLVEGGIRPARISLLAPAESGPVLGRAAIHRYGEEVVGDYELNCWAPGQAASVAVAQASSLHGTSRQDTSATSAANYAQADLRLCVTPVGSDRYYPAGGLQPAPDWTLELKLGRKARIDIVAACATGIPACEGQTRISVPPQPADAVLTSGGGSDWEETLEEALFSLAVGATGWPAVRPASAELASDISTGCPATGSGPQPVAPTAVLAFSGTEGLGSANFVRDFWALCGQAEELLAAGSVLPPPEQEVSFDPALTVASALVRHQRLVLFSPGLAQHEEGDELLERMAEWPHLRQRLYLCGAEADLWALLQQSHGSAYRLAVFPLGWRGHGRQAD